MNTKEAIAFFGTQSNLGSAIGINQGSVSAWGECPPFLRQLQIEAASGGVLKSDKRILDLPKKAALRIRKQSIGKPIKKAISKNPAGKKLMGLSA